MKRAILAIVGTISGLVLLLGFKSHPAGHGTAGAAGTAAGQSPGTGGGSPGTTTGGGSSGTRTVSGDAIDTRWGPVQVQVTLTDGKIMQVTALRLPDGNPRDREINNFAVPQLTQEALAAQSAQIDAVSGATYTSDGYVRSLQSALDRAGSRPSGARQPMTPAPGSGGTTEDDDQ
jgi:major membrane immunogen (membrane-anchored lipoprotein)